MPAALSWVLAAACMGIIAWMSLQEVSDVPGIGTLAPDCINHAAAYCLLSLIVFIALQRTRPSSMGFTFAFVVGWALVFGLGMEFAQKHLTETRHFSLTDLLADGAGAALACLFMLALSKSGDKGRQVYALLTGSR